MISWKKLFSHFFIMYNLQSVILLIFFIAAASLSSSSAGDVIWPLKELQGNSSIVRKKYADMLGKECTIERIALGPDGRPVPVTPAPPSTGRRRRRSPINEFEADEDPGEILDDSISVREDANPSENQKYMRGRHIDGGGPRGISIEDVYRDIEDLVKDPCQDEENRSFMECVLYFKKDIAKTDPKYNKGTCMCYRDWSSNSRRIPAYDHNLDYEAESSEWFTWNNKLKERVIKIRKRCAPGGTLIVPYHCEPFKDPHTGRTREGRCDDSETDPHFMICVAKGHLIYPNFIVILFLELTLLF